MNPKGKPMNRFRLGSMVAIATLAAGLLLAGCGDNEQKNDYVDQINELQLAYVDDVTTAVSEQPPTNPEEAAEAAGTLAELTNGVADDIEAVEPPEDVADLHQQLVDELRGVADQISDAQGAIAGGDPDEAAKAATDLQSAITATQTTLNGLIDQINSTLQG